MDKRVLKLTKKGITKEDAEKLVAAGVCLPREIRAMSAKKLNDIVGDKNASKVKKAVTL